MEAQDPRLTYLNRYANKYYPNISFDEETGDIEYSIPALIEIFLRKYDYIISCLPLKCTEDNFYARIKKPAQCLGLNMEGLWGFTVMLYYCIMQFCPERNMPQNGKNRIPIQKTNWFTVEDELQRLGKLLYDEQKSMELTKKFEEKDNPAFKNIECFCIKPKAKITFSIPRIKIEITNEIVLEEITRILLSKHGERRRKNNLLIHPHNFKISLRAASYWILKTLSEELPINRENNTKLCYQECQLYLSILELFRFNLGENIDKKKNHVIIRKLFNDYKDFNIHFPTLDLFIS